MTTVKIKKDSLTKIAEKQKIYCMEVPNNKNFLVRKAKKDIVVHNCAGWSLRQLINEGLGGVPGKITSRPAKHLQTLVNQMVNFLGCMQNEWAGAQAFSSIDSLLAPYVRNEALSYNEVKKCLQSLIYGLNIPCRWGSQPPFTNVTFDWVPPVDLKNRFAVVGGEEKDYTYGELQHEMDMINKAFIEIMIEGDAAGRGFQYPIPTYNITKDFVWDSENARLLFEMTAKYGTPYFQNFVNSDLNPSDVRSMCCRLQLDKRELRKRGGGLFGSDEFTGSMGVVTINLPQLAYLNKGDKEGFYKGLDHLIDLASESLTIKRRVVKQALDDGLFPYTKRYLAHLNNHFNTIGINGGNEACMNFFDPSVTTGTEKGKQFMVEILTHMRSRMQDLQEQTGDLYNLEQSPGESCSFRLALHDKKNYPDIIASGVNGSPFYTNSSQLPVDFTDDVFEALDLQEETQTLYTGGSVMHIHLGEQIYHWQGCRDFVKAVIEGYRIPYVTISPVYSTCEKHGYLSGEQWECPQCKAEQAQLEKRLEELKAQLV